ncbi:MAG: class I SAM-dependent methyltransferase [Agriterribacter sp.]
MEIIDSIKQSKVFFEGKNNSSEFCDCEKCKISRYRHTHEPHLSDPDHSYWNYLKYCIEQVTVDGIWLEFGVGSGKSISFIAAYKPDVEVYGFDSFEGLPEDWVFSDSKVYKKNTYSRNGMPPEIKQKNVKLVKGMYIDTLPVFCNQLSQQAAFIHIDCDLYTSTKQVLDTLHSNAMIKNGTVILFDEFYNYQHFEKYEYKAFVDFISESKLSYKWIAHTESFVDWNGNQCALVIESGS